MKNILFTLTVLLLFSTSSIVAQDSNSRKVRNEKLSLNFNLGIGFMKPQVEVISGHYENIVIPKVSLMNNFGFEVEYNVTKNLSILSGFFLDRRSYKLALQNRSSSTVFAYSSSFPLFMRYNFSQFQNSAYFSMGAYYNIEKEDLSFARFGSLDGVLVDEMQPIEFNNVSIGMEFGKRFRIFNIPLSAAAFCNYSWEKSFSGKFIDQRIEDLNEQHVGSAMSNGSVVGLRIKYHFGLFHKEDSKKSSITTVDSETKLYKNYFNVDILGESLFYGLSYERFLLRKNWLHFSLKAGVSYIPEYDDGSFSNDVDATKTMGLFIPTSVNLYIGKTKSFVRVGQAIVPTYSPYYYPELHESDYGWFTYYVSILGYRFEYKKWAINAHLNFQFTSPVPYGGFSIARAF